MAIPQQHTKFAEQYDENAAYLGWPTYLIVIGFSAAQWRKPVGRLLIGTLVLACVMSLGSTLRVHGHAVLPLPWGIGERLPLFNQVAPHRFMMYASLVTAMIVAMWASAAVGERWTRPVLVSLAVLSLAPNLAFRAWHSAVDTPEFFTSGAYKRYLPPGAIARIVPFGHGGNGMLWQAKTHMAFRMAEGIPDDPLGRIPIMVDREEVRHRHPRAAGGAGAARVPSRSRYSRRDHRRAAWEPGRSIDVIRRPLHGWQPLLAAQPASVIRTQG
jgi:hypothetical protein